MPDTAQAPSRLLNYLPPVYQNDFLGQFLLAFDDILLGFGNPDFQGLEEVIANTASFFDPQNPHLNEEFLAWLASWTAFSLRADLSPTQQRDFIARIIPLYQRRGTKENLIELLKIFTIGNPRIREAAEGMQIGERSTVGEDTYLGSDLPPHFFEITISLPTIDPNQLGRQIEIARALIELEKPAHTFYTLNITPGFPTLQIGYFEDGIQKGHSTVGVDTILGTVPDETPSQ
jgi:phage tail-like protein